MAKRKMLFVFLWIILAIITLGCQRTPEQRAQAIANHIVEKLELNDAQKKQLNSIREEFVAKSPAMRTSREETFNELVALIKSPKIDKDKVNTLVDRNRQQADECISFFAAKFVEFHDLLTPEQRDKAAREMEEWKGRHGGRD